VYSGSWDGLIRVWSGDDGTHLQTLENHENGLCALAVGLDGKVYSGSADGDGYDPMIRVWSGDDGAHLRNFEERDASSYALAVGMDGKIYSAGLDHQIGVWSSEDGAELQTIYLEIDEHDECVDVWALAVGLDGKIYSGSDDKTIRGWSGEDGTLLHTLVGHTGPVFGMAFGRDGSLFSCSGGGKNAKNMLMW
jgi:WD40 repeat protein